MVNRREFLHATAIAGVGIASADFVHAAPNVTVTKVQIPEAEKIVITVITDNLADATRLDYKIAKRLTYTSTPLDAAVHGEHGLSYHIEAVVDGKSHCCLYDFGTDARGIMRNMDLLKIDLRRVEALGLSHDHWDHQVAMVEVLKTKRQEFGKELPLYIGEQFFAGTYNRAPGGKITQLNLVQKEDIEALGFVKLVEIKTPTAIIPGVYLPGKVEQVTDYERVASNFVAKKGNEFVQETFPGEQMLVLNAKGKGLVVVSCCAHRGIVNSVRQAQRMTGVEKVHAVIGGCHLTNARPELILKTVADMKAINPDYIVPMHCTGYEAAATFAREMPNNFILNTAGTRYVI